MRWVQNWWRDKLSSLNCNAIAVAQDTASGAAFMSQREGYSIPIHSTDFFLTIGSFKKNTFSDLKFQ